MAITVWFNEFFTDAKEGVERSVPYSSRRSALRAREKQRDRTFIGDPIEELFELGSPEAARCQDCPFPDRPCMMCRE